MKKLYFQKPECHTYIAETEEDHVVCTECPPEERMQVRRSVELHESIKEWTVGLRKVKTYIRKGFKGGICSVCLLDKPEDLQFINLD